MTRPPRQPRERDSAPDLQPDPGLEPDPQPDLESDSESDPQSDSEPLCSPERRLQELGLELPPAPAPVAAYVPAVQSGRFVYTAGQLPFVDGQLLATGLVGTGPGYMELDQARECARTCAVNALAALRSVIGSLDLVEQVLKANVFIASDPKFTGQPLVADGCSELLVQVFGESGRHARSAVGVAALPLGAPVEVDLIVAVVSKDYSTDGFEPRGNGGDRRAGNQRGGDQRSASRLGLDPWIGLNESAAPNE